MFGPQLETRAFIPLAEGSGDSRDGGVMSVLGFESQASAIRASGGDWECGRVRGRG
jgi:hypothetical protein